MHGVTRIGLDSLQHVLREESEKFCVARVVPVHAGPANRPERRKPPHLPEALNERFDVGSTGVLDEVKISDSDDSLIPGVHFILIPSPITVFMD